MDEVNLNLNDEGTGAFFIMDGEEEMGEMTVGLSGENLTVYHTQVSPKAGGKGYAKKMLDAMVHHARVNHLKVIPLCSYVHDQFKRHPYDYADIWKKKEDGK